MTSPSPSRFVLAALACGLVMSSSTPGMAVPGTAARDPELAREPSWRIPPIAEIRAAALDWLASSGGGEPPSAGAAARAAAAWQNLASGTGGGDVLDAVMETIACGAPRAAAIHAANAGADEPPLEWLDAAATPAFVRDAVKLWWGRELVRWNRFDEALPILEGLDVSASVDPAALLFHTAACQHWLVAAEAAAESLDRLLEREADIPVRYARVARLLRADLATLDQDSLDHIARRMRDVTRRLDLGRAGPATREVQDGVVAALDKLIKQLEDQQQDQQGQGGGGGGSGSGGQGGVARPMEDSRIAGGRGPGEVRSRDLGAGDAWGDLPPHDRERALQQIGREFPPHYREAIEQYFKRLAAGAEDR